MTLKSWRDYDLTQDERDVFESVLGAIEHDALRRIASQLTYYRNDAENARRQTQEAEKQANDAWQRNHTERSIAKYRQRWTPMASAWRELNEGDKREIVNRFPLLGGALQEIQKLEDDGPAPSEPTEQETGQ